MRPAAFSSLLVVEDNAHDMFLFTRLLKSTGAAHPLHIALNGEEAIDLLDRVVRRSGLLDCPGAAFVDTRMPKMDGLEVLAWIRKRPALDRLPVIMLSHSDDAREIARAGKLGAQCYFTKYPSLTAIARALEESARFGGNPGSAIFDLPSNLLQARTRGASDK